MVSSSVDPPFSQKSAPGRTSSGSDTAGLSTTTQARARRPCHDQDMKDLRRLVVTLVIGSFSLAALLGIVALLGGGDFGETEGRILLTTIIVGVESVAVLCYLSVSGSRWSAVGAVGAAGSLVAFGLALWMTWSEMLVDGDGPWKAFGIAVTLAASFAQASLLLALCGRTRVNPGLAATLIAVAIVAVMIVIAIVDGSGLSDGYWRVFGVIAILDVLGTVILTATGAFGRIRGEADQPSAGVRLSPGTQARLAAAAQERGVSASALLDEALDAYLTPR